jgi:hypothetical protein
MEFLAVKQDLLVDGGDGVLHRRGVWFPEEVREMAILAEQYDSALSLLQIEDRNRHFPLQPKAEEDTYDRLTVGRR